MYQQSSYVTSFCQTVRPDIDLGVISNIINDGRAIFLDRVRVLAHIGEKGILALDNTP